MKRLVSTALVLALLGGTSALAAPQDDQRGDRGGRAEQGGRGDRGGERQARPEAARPQAAPQAQTAPQVRVAPQPQQRGPGWEHARERAAPQAQNNVAQPAPQAQAPSGRNPGWNGYRQDRGGPPAAAALQDRPGPGGFNGRDDRYGRDDRDDRGRPGFQGGPNARGPAGPGWERAGRPGARPPAVRPQDRRDRDFDRQRFDPRRWSFDHRPTHRYQWRGYYRVPYGFYPQAWYFGQVLPWSWYTPDYYIDDWSAYGLQPPAYGCEWVREGNDALMVDIYTGRVLSVVYGLFF